MYRYVHVHMYLHTNIHTHMFTHILAINFGQLYASFPLFVVTVDGALGHDILFMHCLAKS